MQFLWGLFQPSSCQLLSHPLCLCPLSCLPVPPLPPPHLLLTTYPGQLRRSRGERWWQVGFGGLGDPQASSPSELVCLGCSSPGVPDPTSVKLKTPPHFLPSPAEMGSTGPTAGPAGCQAAGSPCQEASGYKWRGTAPCTCGHHNSPERRLLGWGEEAGSRPFTSSLERKTEAAGVWGACCVQVRGWFQT